MLKYLRLNLITEISAKPSQHPNQIQLILYKLDSADTGETVEPHRYFSCLSWNGTLIVGLVD